MFSRLFKNLIILTLIFSTSHCGGLSKTDTRKVPVNAQERARKNIEEGRGTGLGNILGRGKTNFEFSSSNPMWRASLEVLDFLPLNTVDYSGGMIISDWYSDGSSLNEAIKISVRFLSNEVRSDSIKVIVHKKNCTASQSCQISKVEQSVIVDEIQGSILRIAANLVREDKEKKKKKN